MFRLAVHRGVCFSFIIKIPEKTMRKGDFFLHASCLYHECMFQYTQYWDYRYFLFKKVCIMTISFYERPILVFVFANWKKSEENFCFYEKKKVKSKNCVQCLFCNKHHRGGTHPAKIPPWEPQSASQHPVAIALTVSVNIYALSKFILCIH